MTRGRVVNTHFRQIYLQFPFFTKEEAECDTLYDKLIYTIKNMGTMERMPERFRNEKALLRLEELASKAHLSLHDRLAYERAVDRYYYSQITKEEIWEKGLQEGMQKGMEKGMEKGIEKGILSTARNFKLIGISYADIAKATNLPIDVIERL